MEYIYKGKISRSMNSACLVEGDMPLFTSVVRDALGSKEYFDLWCEFVQRRNIDHDRAEVDSELHGEGRLMCGDDLVKHATHLLVMKYGRGDEITSIQGDLDQLIALLRVKRNVLHSEPVPPDIRTMYLRLDLGSLYDSLTALSFVLALRLPAEKVHLTLGDIGHEGEDSILDFARLKLGKSGGKTAAQPRFPKIYGDLDDLVSAPARERPGMLQAFVRGWYKKMKPIYWHDSHKGAEGAYFGYWCFEAALMAMLLEIDDSSLVSHPNYPKELVQHYRTRC